MIKNLQNFTKLSKFASKNTEIPFIHYLFGKSIPLFTNSNKELREKQFTLANDCLNLNEWFDLVLP